MKLYERNLSKQAMAKYYLDSCIWLNLFNKEQNKVQNVPVWKIAQEFLKQYKGDIISSLFVAKEIEDKTSDKKEEIKFLKQISILKDAEDKEYILGREIESKEGYHLSFFDCMHLAIAKTRGYILVTRDRELLERGKIPRGNRTRETIVLNISYSAFSHLYTF